MKRRRDTKHNLSISANTGHSECSRLFPNSYTVYHCKKVDTFKKKETANWKNRLEKHWTSSESNPKIL